MTNDLVRLGLSLVVATQASGRSSHDTVCWTLDVSDERYLMKPASECGVADAQLNAHDRGLTDGSVSMHAMPSSLVEPRCPCWDVGGVISRRFVAADLDRRAKPWEAAPSNIHHAAASCAETTLIPASGLNQRAAERSLASDPQLDTEPNLIGGSARGFADRRRRTPYSKDCVRCWRRAWSTPSELGRSLRLHPGEHFVPHSCTRS